jgi:hypothetical protein
MPPYVVLSQITFLQKKIWGNKPTQRLYRCRNTAGTLPVQTHLFFGPEICQILEAYRRTACTGDSVKFFSQKNIWETGTYRGDVSRESRFSAIPFCTANRHLICRP